jgi:hypothetical protein
VLEHGQLIDDEGHRVVRASQQAGGVGHLRRFDERDRLLDLSTRELQPQLGGLMDGLKEVLVAMRDLLRGLLKRQQFVGAEVALVVGRRSPWQDRLVQVCHCGLC